MLNHNPACRRKQGGVVLLITLIVLVVMTLASLALTRSVDTNNMIAGNLAFQQAATQSGQGGIEVAITWLEANAGTAKLSNADLANGYVAAGFAWAPAAGQSWDAYWDAALRPAGSVVTLPADSAGNSVSYTIHRLCNGTGAPGAVGAGCSFDPKQAAGGGDKGPGASAEPNSQAAYYRITVRIDGPRNTRNYLQAMVQM